MNPREIAQALAAVTVVADAAKARKDQLRADLLAALDEAGADSARAELPDGQPVGKASLAGGKRSPVVVSDDDLASYVQQDSPSEVVVRVRESYRRVLLDRLVEGPDGMAVDPATGVIVPGVVFAEGTRYVSMRFDRQGRDAVMGALMSGALPWEITAPLEIEGGNHG